MNVNGNIRHTTSGFAKLGGKVATQTLSGTETAGDSLNGARLRPQLRKAAGALSVILGQHSTQVVS